jgi:hypothetical protein
VLFAVTQANCFSLRVGEFLQQITYVLFFVI